MEKRLCSICRTCNVCYDIIAINRVCYSRYIAVHSQSFSYGVLHVR